MKQQPAEILLVEDNPHDAELAFHALQKNRLLLNEQAPREAEGSHTG